MIAKILRHWELLNGQDNMCLPKDIPMIIPVWSVSL